MGDYKVSIGKVTLHVSTLQEAVEVARLFESGEQHTEAEPRPRTNGTRKGSGDADAVRVGRVLPLFSRVLECGRLGCPLDELVSIVGVKNAKALGGYKIMSNVVLRPLGLDFEDVIDIREVSGSKRWFATSKLAGAIQDLNGGGA